MEKINLEPLNVSHVKKPAVSIVVSNWNSEKFAVPCLDSVFASNYQDIEVILVDDGSTDDGPGLAEAKYKCRANFHIIKHHAPQGLTAVFNEGFKLSQGEYIVFMHSDTLVDSFWLDHLLNAMTDESIGCCGGKILSMNDRKIILGAGHKVDYLGYPVRNDFNLKLDDGTYDMAQQVFDIWDACMMIRRKVLLDVGLFDEDFFYANEEIDLCWRINLAGYKVIYVPSCVIYHKAEIISKAVPLGFAYQMSKNYLQTVLKNYGKGSLIKYFPAMLALIWTRILIESVRGNGAAAKAMARGFFWNFSHFRIIMEKRHKIQTEIRKVDDDEIRKVMLPVRLSLYLASVKKN